MTYDVEVYKHRATFSAYMFTVKDSTVEEVCEEIRKAGRQPNPGTFPTGTRYIVIW